MIISCEKCNKKFEVNDNLIPSTGRLLQCGTCHYKWNFVPSENIEKKPSPKPFIEDKIQENIVKKKDPKINSSADKINVREINTSKKKVGFLSYILVIIISLIALLILFETFENYLIKIFPDLNFYLLSLYETLNDIFLFFLDLF